MADGVVATDSATMYVKAYNRDQECPRITKYNGDDITC
jgi:hypothetical protein